MTDFFSNTVDSVSLSDWVSEHSSVDDLQRVFLNMDRALKYIHDHGYCIEVFHPKYIEILDNRDDYIQFKLLLKLPSDNALREEMISEDIFRSSLIQIAIYSECMDKLTPDFLREHFDQFVQAIPNDWVPYYRGVIQRGSSVYLCEYELEKRNRDLENLEEQLGQEGSSKNSLVKKTGKVIGIESATNITNSSVNDKIYGQINGGSEAAFINYLLVPTLIFGLLLLICIVGWVISLF